MKKIYLLIALLFVMTNCAYAIDEEAILNEQTDNQDSVFLEPESTRLFGQAKKNKITTLDNYEEDEITSSANIDVVTRRDIERQDKPSITQLLNQMSSVTTNTANGSEGNVTTFRIRGTDRVRTMMDGVRIDRPSGTSSGAETQFLLSDDIETLEVIKGPQGNVSGVNASGGAVMMQTRRGEGPFGFELGSDFGSKGTFKERAAIMGGNEKADYYLSTTWYKTDGGMYTKHLGDIKRDDYNSLHTVANFGLRMFDNKAELRDVFRFARSRKDIGINTYTDAAWNSHSYQDPNDYAKNVDVMNALTFKHAPVDWYDYNLRFGVYHNQNNSYLLPDDMKPFYNSLSRVGSTRLNLNNQHNFKYKDWNTFTLGYNLESEYLKGKSNTDSNGVNYLSKYSGSSVQNDIYAHDVINIKDILYIRGGARFLHHSDYGYRVTPNASLALVLPTFGIQGAKTKFKGSWGQSVNAPTLYQRFGELYDEGMISIPNPNLKAEKLTGFDFGVEQYFMDEKLRFEFGFFNSDYKDYINYTGTYDYATMIYTGNYYNTDEARIYGYEGKMTFEPNDKFKLVFNYTYSSSKDEKTGFDLAAVPTNRFNTMIYFTPWERWNIYMGAETASSRQINADSRAKTSGYVDARLGTSLRLFSVGNLDFYLKGNIYNLFNQKICMFRNDWTGDSYFAPKLRYNLGLFIEFKNKDRDKNKERV